MKKRTGRWIACLLVCIMMLLQGCGSRENRPAGEQGSGSGAGGAQASTEEGRNGGGERSMGRYLEKEMTLPEDVTVVSYPTMCLQKLETGALMLIEKTAGVYVSEDNGESWSSREASWLRELRERYISSMAIGPDGSVALIYILSGEEGEDDSYR